MKILLSAYDCDPYAGSESGVGWNWAIELSRDHDVTVLTRASHREAIEHYESTSPTNLRFEYFDKPALKYRLEKLPYGPNLYYDIWQRSVISTAKRLHAKYRFDVAHHLTWGGWRHPSYLHRLGIPLIFGPVGGGDSVPRQLRTSFPLKSRLWEICRDIGNRCYLMLPAVSECLAESNLIICRTEGTRAYIPRKYWEKVYIHREIGVDSSRLDARPQVSHRNEILRVLYVGRFLPAKGVDLAVRAFASFCRRKPGRAHLDLVGGQGYFTTRIRDLVSKLQIEDQVTIHGWLTHEQVKNLYRQHDLFLFPSLRDSGGTVVLESLAAGVPVICLDLGGPPRLLGGQGGIVVQAQNKTEEEVVQGLATALTEVNNDAGLLLKLQSEARDRAEQLTWTKTVESVYRLVTNNLHSSIGEEAGSGA